MPGKTYPHFNSFNAGEISELLYNRDDITKYKSACRTLENAFPLVEGGAKKMPGTYFAGAAKQHCRLVSFQFSTDQGAILELSQYTIRIWEPSSPGTWDLGLVLSGGSPLELVTPYLDEDLFFLDCSTQSADVLWIFHPSYPPACVERFGAGSWTYTTVPPGATPYGFVAPGVPAYRGTPDVVTSGFEGLGVPILQITQTYQAIVVTAKQFNLGDRVYINGCAGMVEMNRGEFFLIPVLNSGDQASFTGHIDDSGSNAGTILTVSSVASGTILVGMLVRGANVTPGTIISEDLGGGGGAGQYQVNVPQKVSSTGLLGIGGFAYNLIEADIGSIFTASISGTVMTVTAIIAGVVQVGAGIYYPGVVGGTYIASFGTGTGGIGTYNLNTAQTASSQQMSIVPVPSEAYQEYQGGGFATKVVPLFDSTNNYPSCGTFYQGRMCLAGTNNQPSKMYGSVIQDFPDYIADPTADDYGVQFTLLSTKLDQILNMIGGPNAMLLGTAGGVWTIQAGSGGTSLSQSSVSALKQTTWGVSYLQPQPVGDCCIFVSRSMKIVMFLVYNFTTNQWENYDLTRMNRNITIGA